MSGKKRESQEKLVKINMSVATNQRNDGKIDTTCILREDVADQIIKKLDNQDELMHFEIFEYLYNLGYLEARAGKMYECDENGKLKEED